MAMDSLKDLYVEELKDLYNAENQLLKALPRMAKKASSPDLRAAFEEHLGQTERQVNRLEKIFKGLGENIVIRRFTRYLVGEPLSSEVAAPVQQETEQAA